MTKRPTAWQRQILLVLADGGRMVRDYEGERCLWLLDHENRPYSRVYGGMRHRLTRNGWISRLKITEAGREAVAP